MLHLDNNYLWDFWTLQHQGQTHLYYLNAPRDIDHPEDRHKRARVGHAVSSDLKKLGGASWLRLKKGVVMTVLSGPVVL